jgi:hypothetical protein
MATRLKVEIRSAIRFSHARHTSAAEIRRQLVEVYGKEVTSHQSVAEWCSDFKSCQVGTMENEGCGRTSKSRSVSGGQLWNIRHTGQIWRQVIFTSFPLLRIIFVVTNWQVMTT